MHIFSFFLLLLNSLNSETMFASSYSWNRSRDRCYHCEEVDCIITDVSSGDVTCTSCGTVQEERMIVDDLDHNGWCLESHYPISNSSFSPNPVINGSHSMFLDSISKAPAVEVGAAAGSSGGGASGRIIAVQDHQDHHITPQRKHGFELVNTFLEALQLRDSYVAVHAQDLCARVMSALHFKARPFVAAMACCVYLACRDSRQQKVPRSAQEIMDKLDIEASVFNKVLKDILLKLPQETKQMDSKQHVKHTDGLGRQLQQIKSVPLNVNYAVGIKAAELDIIRKKHHYMLATPPTHTNAVLIALACELMQIPLDVNELIDRGWIAASTLKKHIAAMKKWI